MQIGIDTSVIVALLDEADLWHAAAVRLHDTLIGAQIMPVYFDCVLAEAVSTIARRAHEKRRQAEVGHFVDRLSSAFPADMLTWILPDVPALYEQVMGLIRSSSGALNFNDSLLALSCRERGIRMFASFDSDFDSIPWLVRVATPEDITHLLPGGS